jgi:hypothetical protein
VRKIEPHNFSRTPAKLSNTLAKSSSRHPTARKKALAADRLSQMSSFFSGDPVIASDRHLRSCAGCGCMILEQKVWRSAEEKEMCVSKSRVSKIQQKVYNITYSNMYMLVINRIRSGLLFFADKMSHFGCMFTFRSQPDILHTPTHVRNGSKQIQCNDNTHALDCKMSFEMQTKSV